MRQIDPALATHLATGATTLCHCWLVERRDGVRLGFTDHDRPLSFEETVFEPESGLDAAAWSATSDLAIDHGEAAGALSSERLTADDLASGRYDGARVTLYRVNWQTPSMRLVLRRARIGEIERIGHQFTAELRGLSEALSRPAGRVYQRSCDAVVGDARCGVDLSRAEYRADGTVSTLLEEQRFIAAGLEAFDNHWFDHGALRWISGANAGLATHIKTHANGVNGSSIDLWTPPGDLIAVGDRFEVSAGCDRRAATCREKFDNLINFRGFHLMPGNDFAVSYPVRGEAEASS